MTLNELVDRVMAPGTRQVVLGGIGYAAGIIRVYYQKKKGKNTTLDNVKIGIAIAGAAAIESNFLARHTDGGPLANSYMIDAGVAAGAMAIGYTVGYYHGTKLLSWMK